MELETLSLQVDPTSETIATAPVRRSRRAGWRRWGWCLALVFVACLPVYGYLALDAYHAKGSPRRRASWSPRWRPRPLWRAR